MFLNEFVQEFCGNFTVLEECYNFIAEIFRAYPIFGQIIMAGIVGGFFKGIYKWLIRGLKRFLKPCKKFPQNKKVIVEKVENPSVMNFKSKTKNFFDSTKNDNNTK